jgi:hypothetical protein
MRVPSRKKTSVYQQRVEQWRKDRAAAQTLRDAFPAAARVNVRLQFLQPPGQTSSSQSYELYPPARAHFAYRCPYGDCDGIFDLGVPVVAALSRGASHVEGVLECSGVRSRAGLQRQSCGLRVRYTLAVQYKPEAEVRT